MSVGKHLTPVLVSLVSSNNESTLMLDDSSKAVKELERVKMTLHEQLSTHDDMSPDLVRKLVPTRLPKAAEAICAGMEVIALSC